MTREGFWGAIALAAGAGFGLLNALFTWQGASEMAVRRVGFSFLLAMLFSFSLVYVTVPIWRIALIPARRRTIRAVVLINGSVAVMAGVASFYLAFMAAAIVAFGWDWWMRSFQVAVRASATGAVATGVSIPLILAWAGGALDRRSAGRERRIRRLAEEARLVALRAQINPHFFFNALNTIAALIPSRPKDAERAVELLAESLRPALMRDQPLVQPLEQEFAIARAYAEIELLRHGDRLTIHLDLPSDCEGIPVPSLFLQPLVENAITHGAAKTMEPFTVCITAEKRGSQVVVRVRGTPANQRMDGNDESLREAPRQPGHALHNIAARTLALLGPEAQLSVRLGADHSSCAELALPINSSPNEVSHR